MTTHADMDRLRIARRTVWLYVAAAVVPAALVAQALLVEPTESWKVVLAGGAWVLYLAGALLALLRHDAFAVYMTVTFAGALVAGYFIHLSGQPISGVPIIVANGALMLFNYKAIGFGR